MAFDYATLKSRLYSVAKYNTGSEFTNVSIMTGEEIHSNFRELADGEIDLNDRVVVQEQLPKAAGSTLPGIISYNGNQEGGGVFYGGQPLQLSAVSTATLPVSIDENNLRSFIVAEGSGIKYLPGGSIDTDATVWYEIDYGPQYSAPHSFSDLPTLVTYLNNNLINNGSPFYISGTVDLLAIPDWNAVFSWDVNPVSFYISIDDSDEVLITLDTKVYPAGGGGINGPEGVALIINNELTAAGLATKVQAQVVTVATSKYIRIVGLNSRPAGCSRVRITKKVDETTQVLEQLGLLTEVETERAIFDFSTTFQFVIRDTYYVDIEGLNSYSKLLLRGNNLGLTAENIFTTLALPIGEINPVLVYNTADPNAEYRLNFGGDFYARALYATDKVYAAGVELTSTRKLKKDIEEFTDSALSILREVDIVSFKYKKDPNQDPKVGFIAEDTHALLATPRHDSMDVMNSIGLIIKGLQELSAKVDQIEQRIS